MILHSLRFLKFGLQIFENKKIVNFECANEEWQRLEKDENKDWNHYYEIYHETKRQLMSLYPPSQEENPLSELENSYRILGACKVFSGAFSNSEKTAILQIVREHNVHKYDEEKASSFEKEFPHFFRIYKGIAQDLEDIINFIDTTFSDLREKYMGNDHDITKAIKQDFAPWSTFLFKKKQGKDTREQLFKRATLHVLLNLIQKWKNE